MYVFYVLFDVDKCDVLVFFDVYICGCRVQFECCMFCKRMDWVCGDSIGDRPYGGGIL